MTSTSDTGSAAEHVERWQVPAIDGAAGSGYLTAGRLEELQKQAYDEAWSKGEADGRRAGEEIIRERAEHLEKLFTALTTPFEELDDQIEKQLVELSMTVLRQLFRREIREQPDHVVGVVREAIQCLPVASRQVQIHLHPDDAALVREVLSPAEGEPAWSVVEDPLQLRGGCRVTSASSQIDASADARLESIIQRIVGEERR